MIIELGSAPGIIDLEPNRTVIELDNPLRSVLSDYWYTITLVNQDGDTLVDQDGNELTAMVKDALNTVVVDLE